MNAQSVYSSIKQGILICDEQSRILYFNDSYAAFIGEKLENVKGRLLREIRPGAIAPQVIKEGRPIQSVLRVEKGKEYFADIYPIRENGCIVGTVSVVTTLEDAVFIKEKMNELEQEEQTLRERLNHTNGTRYTFANIIGKCTNTMDAVNLAKKAAGHPANILLQGESGTGKELFAQSIHNESSRSCRPFVAVNCAVLSKTLLESELFGYEEGAFTGAKKKGKPGLFETAKGGTLFLDEISEMDIELQSKLLRVLQEKKFRRLGGTKEIESDVCIISACNIDLLKYIEEKKFRRDLYYRIAVIPIIIPPLRDRMEDISLLTDYFMQNIQIQHKTKYRIDKEVRELFRHYPWPGNIRELRNTLEYCAMMANNGEISIACLPPIMIRTFESGKKLSIPLQHRVRDFERAQILQELNHFGNDTAGKRKAAQELGISLSSLYAKLEK